MAAPASSSSSTPARPQQRLAIGRVSQLNLVDAQNEAKQKFAMVARGEDPGGRADQGRRQERGYLRR